ncbi:hypothetical protein ACWGOQ_0012440 [Aquimarina sp. M1]
MNSISRITLQVRASNTSTKSLELEKVIPHSEIPTVNLSEDQLDKVLGLVSELVTETRDRVLEEYTAVYEFKYKFYDQNDVLLEAKDRSSFFDELVEQAIVFPGLHHKLLLFVKDSYYKENNERFWRDSETPVGTTIATLLALSDIQYIQNYIDFLRTNDMDHEVDQYGDISNIINKYGICKETLSLALVRAGSACGQHGSEQFEELLDQGFLEYIQSNFDLFLKKLDQEHEFDQLWFLDLDYEEFWNPGDMETEWIDTILDVLDEEQKEKFRLFFKERL